MFITGNSMTADTAGNHPMHRYFLCCSYLEVYKEPINDLLMPGAKQGGYEILAQTCYDAHSVIGLVRSAERMKSPTILQLFPVTLAYRKGPFLQFCFNAAHQASVPITVHLDHATDPEHIELALSLAEQGIASDNIMVDASHAETDKENITIAHLYIERAAKCGVTVEVKLACLEGGETGLHVISDAKPMDPTKVSTFINSTEYRQPAQVDILKALHSTFSGKVPLCLHSTGKLPNTLFVKCIRKGISKDDNNYFDIKLSTQQCNRMAKNKEEVLFGEELNDGELLPTQPTSPTQEPSSGPVPVLNSARLMAGQLSWPRLFQF
ncbi:hypothetical protein B0H10DRAFT_2220041 [Mycena sp. CBHHK59/15]|nr:hypothetical protein B0H10DRAFT_2220041 [Mycena sp. CBHHK59/15]